MASSHLDNEFVESLLEQLALIGNVRARAMFGGHGIYHADTMFAIVVDDIFYLKADNVTRPQFIARGLNPFSYVARGKTVTMQYYEAPPELFEDEEAMLHWARQAIEVSLRAKKEKRKS